MAVLHVCLLDVKLSVLRTNLVSLIEDHIVHLFGLVEEMIICISRYRLVPREEFTRSYVWAEVLLHKVRDFTLGLVEIVQVIDKRSLLRVVIHCEST